MSYVKAKVNQSDMKESMIQRAVDCVASAIGSPKKSPVEIANYVRDAFDNEFGPSWTCIVGKDFSSSFAYEKKKHISLEVNGQQVLLFKSA